MRKLQSEDYNQECSVLAQYLLGKILARKLKNGKILKGIIVETEAYLGGDDKASHSFNGKMTERNKPMFAAPGTSYVYTIYGMYHCVNISAQGAGAAVLLRALEPLENLEEMRLSRMSIKNNPKFLKDVDICNGPSKLCISFNITKELNNLFMPESEVLWVEERLPHFEECTPIIKSTRIGIERCGTEWATKKLRYYVFKCPHVSKRDKKSEKDFETLQRT
uniref:DNA-3-methyladenine glycosylase n=1 Tax=Lygus hesperus TaxID=30085 RepID=A0A0A9Z4S5_LYGHE